MIIDPPNHIQRITAVWAAISADETGEGICAVNSNGTWMPLLAADEKRLEWIVDQARTLAKMTGKRIKIIKLTSRIEVMEIPAFGASNEEMAR